jgi:hypothetical protein
VHHLANGIAIGPQPVGQHVVHDRDPARLTAALSTSVPSAQMRRPIASKYPGADGVLVALNDRPLLRGGVRRRMGSARRTLAKAHRPERTVRRGCRLHVGQRAQAFLDGRTSPGRAFVHARERGVDVDEQCVVGIDANSTAIPSRANLTSRPQRRAGRATAPPAP